MFGWLKCKSWEEELTEKVHKKMHEKGYSPYPRDEFNNRIGELIEELLEVTTPERDVYVLGRRYTVVGSMSPYFSMTRLHAFNILISPPDKPRPEVSNNWDDMKKLEGVYQFPCYDPVDYKKEYKHFIENFDTIKDAFIRKEAEAKESWENRNDEIKSMIDLINIRNSG